MWRPLGHITHYTPSSYFKHCTVLYCTVLYCTVLYCNDLRVLGHITQPAHTATTLSVAICNLLLYLQVRWGPIMCCQESSCQYVGDKSKISIRASLAHPAALQHCSTAALQHCRAAMRILHTVSPLRDTSCIHRAQRNKQQAPLRSINGVLVTRKIRPCHCPHFSHCCRHQAAPELGHLFLSAIWMPIELRPSQNKLTAHQLVLISGSGLNFSACRIMVMRRLSV